MTGVHGANRLASNSLLEGLVFGARTGAAMIRDFPAAKKKATASHAKGSGNPGHLESANHTQASDLPGVKEPLQEIRDLMWKTVGIMRNAKDLAHTLERLRACNLPQEEKRSRHSAELKSIHTLAQLIAHSALTREESRGSHYRSDFPYRNDDDFQKHSVIACGKDVRFEP